MTSAAGRELTAHLHPPACARGAVRARGMARRARVRDGDLLQRRPRRCRRGVGADPRARRTGRRPAARQPYVEFSPISTRPSQGRALLLAHRVRLRAERRPADGLPRGLRRVPGAGRGDRAPAHRRGPQRARGRRRGRRQPRRAVRLRRDRDVGADEPAATLRRLDPRRRRSRGFATGNYINLQTADEGAERGICANFARVAKIKAKYDPDNLFRSNRNVLPA